MSSPVALNLKVSPEARSWIEDFLMRTSLADPVAGLTYGHSSGDPTDTWMVGAYERSQIPKIEEMLAPHGHRAHYLADGIEFCFHQFHLLSKLEGATLHFDGRRFVLL
jgi:hypothetical protein